MTCIINRIIYNGRENQFPCNHEAVFLPDCKKTNCKMAQINGYSCPECRGNVMFIRHDPHGTCCFCSNEVCMKRNSDSSKGRVLEEKKIVEKDAAYIFRLGHRYKNACLAQWMATEDQKKSVLGWLKNKKDTLVLSGPPKTGKTYFCCAIGNYLLEEKEEVYYLNIRRFYEEIQNAISKNENQYGAIRKIASKRILIIDDLAASTNSEWQKEVVLDLIDQRYSNNEPTVITTNLSESEMKNALGERTSRRIFAKGNCKIILTQEVEI